MTCGDLNLLGGLSLRDFGASLGANCAIGEAQTQSLRYELWSLEFTG